MKTNVSNNVSIWLWIIFLAVYFAGTLKTALAVYKEGYNRQGIPDEWFLLAYLSWLGLICWRRYINTALQYDFPLWIQEDEWDDISLPVQYDNHRWVLVMEEHVESTPVVKHSSLYGLSEDVCYWVGSTDSAPYDNYNPCPNRTLKQIVVRKKQVCGNQGWFFLWFEDHGWKIISMTMVPILIRMERNNVSESQLMEYRASLSLKPPAMVIINNQILLLLSLEKSMNVL